MITAMTETVMLEHHDEWDMSVMTGDLGLSGLSTCHGSCDQCSRHHDTSYWTWVRGPQGHVSYFLSSIHYQQFCSTKVLILKVKAFISMHCIKSRFVENK